MKMNSNNMIQFSPHRDVLETRVPETLESRRTLLHEIKNRGKSAVMGTVWMDAKLLYEKALQILLYEEENDNNNNKSSSSSSSSLDKKELSIINANLSLVYSKIGQYDNAEAYAYESTKYNPDYTKGWWRLGQAQRYQQNYSMALESLREAKKLEPNNKALNKEIKTIQEFIKNNPDHQIGNNNSNNNQSKKTPPSLPTNIGTTGWNKDHVVKDDDDDGDDENDGKVFTKSDHVKGYKTVNGKKTSYFHNELSEKDKQLIGDIAPKKIDPKSSGGSSSSSSSSAPATTTNAPMQITSPPVQSETSAWNQAGTWEERDVTKWAKEELKKAFEDNDICKYEVPLENTPWKSLAIFEGDIIACIDKVKSFEGHASVATVRGKKRYIYEFKIQLVWKIERRANKNELLQHGEMTFPDIDGTMEIGTEYDIENYVVKQNYESDVVSNKMVDDIIKNGPFRKRLHKTIDDWRKLFHKTY